MQKHLSIAIVSFGMLALSNASHAEAPMIPSDISLPSGDEISAIDTPEVTASTPETRDELTTTAVGDSEASTFDAAHGSFAAQGVLLSEAAAHAQATAYIHEIEFLTRRANRQHAGAAGMLGFGGLSFGIGAGLGIASLTDAFGSKESHGDIDYGYYDHPSVDSPATSVRRAGFGLMAGATGLSLMTAMPLMRASIANRRAAESLALDPASFEHWNRNKHLGALKQRTGRNLLLGSGGSALSLLVSTSVAIASDGRTNQRAEALVIASATTAIALAIPGVALHFRGKNQQHQEQATREVSASFTPLFLPDGAGGSLWLGF